MNDVIVAIATPIGIGALSIVRLSGDGCMEIVNSFFSKDVLSLLSHTVNYGKILAEDQSTIDEVVLLVMRGRKSFTGEDSIEIICHGSPLITKKIFRRALAAGARSASPGEFSRRAFSNGKIDLLQAEAIKEMIHAKNERALKEASKQLAGSLSIKIKELQNSFIDLLSIIEVHIDYPEEGIEENVKTEVVSMIETTKEKISALTDSFEDGQKLFSGHRISILGAPNAGKSSLLNALLEENRAIVTDIEGTTRDTIEEEILLDNYTFKFIDTAGIREAKDAIEKIGIERSLKTIETSDINLLIIDLTKDVPKEILALYSRLKEAIIVYNKSDISEKLNPLKVNSPIYISAKEKVGLEELKRAIINKVSFKNKDEIPLITKERHFLCLKESSLCLDNVLNGFKRDLSIELISFELRYGLEQLSEVIGINITEEILGGIFSKFCVGK